MKTLAILLLSAWTACGAVMIGSVQDGSGNAILTQPTFTPLFGPYWNGTNVVFPTVQTPHISTNGWFTNTFVAGSWTASWPGLPKLYCLVPDTNGVVTLGECLTNVFTNLIAQVSGHVLPGVSVTMTTNALGTPTETITLSVYNVLLATNAISAGLATNAITATNALLAVLATTAVTATNAQSAAAATLATNATTAANATGLTLTTNAAPTLWTNPVVWTRWTNSTGGVYWSPGYTNGY